MLDKRYEIHFAPLQGLTDAVFRAAFHKYYGGVDFYYTPFIRIERGLFRKRDIRDLAEDEMEQTIPQVLPGSADELKRLCEPVIESGHTRIDINAGCPFPPVMAHNRGAALLNNPDIFFDVLKGVSDLKGDVQFSLKMRLGYCSTTQWLDTIDAINEAGFCHVTMHPRFAKQQYNGECDLEAFEQFLGKCAAPVIYNGDLRSVADVERVVQKFPSIKGIMMGRGLLTNPTLALELRNATIPDKVETFRQFHNEIIDSLQQRMTDGTQIANHMKGYWEYLFPDGDRKALKMIRKAHKLDQYTAGVSTLLSNIAHVQ